MANLKVVAETIAHIFPEGEPILERGLLAGHRAAHEPESRPIPWKAPDPLFAGSVFSAGPWPGFSGPDARLPTCRRMPTPQARSSNACPPMRRLCRRSRGQFGIPMRAASDRPDRKRGAEGKR